MRTKISLILAALLASASTFAAAEPAPMPSHVCAERAEVLSTRSAVGQELLQTLTVRSSSTGFDLDVPFRMSDAAQTRRPGDHIWILNSGPAGVSARLDLQAPSGSMWRCSLYRAIARPATWATSIAPLLASNC